MRGESYIVLQIASLMFRRARLPRRIGLENPIIVSNAPARQVKVAKGKQAGDTYHQDPLQVRMHTAGVLPILRDRSALSPSGDATVLFCHFGGIDLADFEFEHGLAEFGFAEEEEAGVAGGVGQAVVGRLGGDVGLERRDLLC